MAFARVNESATDKAVVDVERLDPDTSTAANAAVGPGSDFADRLKDCSENWSDHERDQVRDSRVPWRVKDRLKGQMWHR